MVKKGTAILSNYESYENVIASGGLCFLNYYHNIVKILRNTYTIIIFSSLLSLLSLLGNIILHSIPCTQIILLFHLFFDTCFIL